MVSAASSRKIRFACRRYYLPNPGYALHSIGPNPLTSGAAAAASRTVSPRPLLQLAATASLERRAMSSYLYELPTTGAVSFADACVDSTATYTADIADATEARANLRAALKESKRTDQGEKDYLRLVKVNLYSPFCSSSAVAFACCLHSTYSRPISLLRGNLLRVAVPAHSLCTGSRRLHTKAIWAISEHQQRRNLAQV